MIIIDVGAHDGTAFSIPFAKDENNIVYAIEPIPQLADKIRQIGLPNLRVSCMAIGEQDGQAIFHINRDSQTSSILKASCRGQWKGYEKQLENVETVEVELCRLDSFIKQNSIPEVDLLKVDAQGYDFQVIKSAGDSIHNIKRIRLEVQTIPLYEGSFSKKEVVSYLEDRGFQLVYSASQTEGLEENLEFIRVNRYSRADNLRDFYEVEVPYIGSFIVPQHDRVGRLLEQQVFEGAEQAFLWLYLRPGDTFFDCGAHAGLFSCIASNKLQNQGFIVGFEPNSQCIELYRQNLARTGFGNFEALPVGLSDKPNLSPLFLGKTGMSAYSTFAARAQSHEEIGQESLVVEQVTLDSIITKLQIDIVEFAKLDVEGWEYRVLSGALQSISAGKFPVWMIEFTEENAIAAGSSTQELRSLLENFGYTLCRFDATYFQLIPEPIQSKYEYQNLFAVLDLKHVNERLASAGKEFVAIARDLVVRSDIAANAAMGLNLISQHNHQLVKRQQAECKLQFAENQLEEAHRKFAELQRNFNIEKQNLQSVEQELDQARQELFVKHQELGKAYKNTSFRYKLFSLTRTKLSSAKSRFITTAKTILPATVVQLAKETKENSNKLSLSQGTNEKPVDLPKHYFSTPLIVPVPPRISIVTPSFNQANYIERTIKSLLEQDYPNLEYYIEDGVSTDGTVDILSKYVNNVTGICSEPDTGQANAINRGFSKCGGEIMAWLNSDDILLPGALKYVANYFFKHPEVDVVYGHRILINANDQMIGKWVLPPHDNNFITWADYIPQETLFWRRSIWEKSGAYIDESYQFALDWELIIRFIEQGATFARLPRFIGGFRVYDEQKTSSWTEVGQLEMDKVRLRCHGRSVTQVEIDKQIKSYQKSAWRYYWLDNLGLLRH